MTVPPLARIVEIAENGRHLAKERGFLTVSGLQGEVSRVALDDIAAIVINAPGTTVTVAQIGEICRRGIPTRTARR